MKKIGLICLTLVLALGALGIGYATWSDTVLISGTVQTGSLDLTVVGYSGTEVYKDLDTDGVVICHWRDVGQGKFYMDNLPPDEGLLISYASAEYRVPTRYDHEILVTFSNLFPCIDFTADCSLLYAGTVPAKVKLTKEVTGVPEAWVTLTIENGDTGDRIVEGTQLDGGEHIHVMVTIHVPQEDSAQGQFGGVRILFEAMQWNEYVIP